MPIAAPATNGGATIDASKPAAAVMLPASGAADVPMPTPTITQNANGSLSISVTVPPSTPPGVYLIAVVGVDASGRSRAIIVPVVVRRVRAAAVMSSSSAPPAKPVFVPASLRAEVEQIQAAVAATGGSESIEKQVLEEGATLDIKDAQLLVNGRALGQADDASSRPLVAAAAVALGGAGLVLLRRRTPAISRRTR